MEDLQAVLPEAPEACYPVTKVNRKKHRENRVLALTAKALYNCKNTTIKRRIDLARVTGVVLNGTNADEFIVKVSEEYDYRYISPARDDIVGKLRWLKTRNALQPATFTTWTVQGGNFPAYCVSRFTDASPPQPQRTTITTTPRLCGQPAFPAPANSLLLAQSHKREVRLLSTSLVQTVYFAEEPVDCFHTVEDPALVLIHSKALEGRFIVVLSEYCECGDLGYLLALNPKGLNPRLINCVAGQIAVGLKALHQQRQAFRELRPSKVLFTAQGDVKLNYAGLDVRQLKLSNYPEYLVADADAFLEDWWALAVLLYEMLRGSVPDSALQGRSDQTRAEVMAALQETLPNLRSVAELADSFTLSPNEMTTARRDLKDSMKQVPMRNRAIRRG